jgi:phage FluMu protein Com
MNSVTFFGKIKSAPLRKYGVVYLTVLLKAEKPLMKNIANLRSPDPMYRELPDWELDRNNRPIEAFVYAKGELGFALLNDPNITGLLVKIEAEKDRNGHYEVKAIWDILAKKEIVGAVELMEGIRCPICTRLLFKAGGNWTSQEKIETACNKCKSIIDINFRGEKDTYFPIANLKHAGYNAEKISPIKRHEDINGKMEV